MTHVFGLHRSHVVIAPVRTTSRVHLIINDAHDESKFHRFVSMSVHVFTVLFDGVSPSLEKHGTYDLFDVLHPSWLLTLCSSSVTKNQSQ